MKKKLLLLPALLVAAFLSAQNIGIGTNLPHPSARLEVASTNSGLLLPRLTTAQRNAIPSPATGLKVYDLNTNSFWFYNGSGWVQLGSSSTNYWSEVASGTIYNTNAGKVLFGSNVIGPAYINIKAPVSTMTTLLLSETGDASSDYLFSGIATGGGTPTTRYGYVLGNFGNGFGIGNQANAPLIFQTYTSEKMRITPGGFVGINTLNPTTQLQVNTASGAPGFSHTNGTVRLATMANSTNAAIGTTTNHHLFFFTANNINTAPPAMTISTAGNVGVGGQVATDKFEVYTPDGSYGMVHTTGTISLGTYTGSSAGWLGTKTAHPLYLFSQTGNSIISLLPNGNGGIGTYTPGARWHVNSNSSTGFAQLLLEEVDNDYARISLKTTNGANGGNNFWSIAGYNNDSRGSEKLNFYNAAAGDLMTITGTGNVGIGTVNPTQKLAVNGTIRAKEVIVETGWADYVFEEEYRLKSLEEVEAFVKKNKHLPGIPSAKEIGEKGLSVAETQTKMMEKIEQLTLYIIALKKEIETLKAKK